MENSIQLDDSNGSASRYFVRESMKREIERSVSKGLHLRDACEIAGLPYEVALSQIATDEDFASWDKLSKDRAMVDRARNKDPVRRPKRRTSLQIKHDFVNKLNNAGLFDKITSMAEEADPSTEEGRQVLAFFMRTVIKDVLPKETAAKVETVNKDDTDKLSDSDLIHLLEERRAERLELQSEIESSKVSRIRHGENLLLEEGSSE